ncbi:MAG: hypothetical protein QW359_00120 [Metallosphaera sp.]
MRGLGFKVKIVTYKYPIQSGVPLPHCLDRLLYETLGRINRGLEEIFECQFHEASL